MNQEEAQSGAPTRPIIDPNHLPSQFQIGDAIEIVDGTSGRVVGITFRPFQVSYIVEFPPLGPSGLIQEKEFPSGMVRAPGQSANDVIDEILGSARTVEK